MPINEGLQVPTQVNYVAKCGAIYAPGEQVSGATSVITRYLGTSYLWDQVRVQGGACEGRCTCTCSCGHVRASELARLGSEDHVGSEPIRVRVWSVDASCIVSHEVLNPMATPG